MDAKEVIALFNVSGNAEKLHPLKIGHINDTFVVPAQDDSNSQYVLQKINSNVFKDIPSLMNNLERVLKKINQEIESKQAADTYPYIIETKNGEAYFQTDDGDYWRLYNYVPNSESYHKCESCEFAYEAARTASRFQSYILDLDVGDFVDTIPLFHNMYFRYEQFDKALEEDALDRVVGVQEEIDFVKERRELYCKIAKLIEDGEVPLRITHNDLKFNNVLFDKNTQKGLCVVDLDTIMPGSILYDFGDLVRSTGVHAFEDETDLSKVFIDLDYFEALLKGYVSELTGVLTPAEKENLFFAPRVITHIIGLRFLTDYLAGDRYFKVQHPKHNLDRARNQFKLVRSMEENEDAMKEIVAMYV